MLGNLPWRYRISRNAPPFINQDTGFLFLTGSFDPDVLQTLDEAVRGDDLQWVVIPVGPTFEQEAKDLDLLPMQPVMRRMDLRGERPLTRPG